jgi:hypothetical protein
LYVAAATTRGARAVHRARGYTRGGARGSDDGARRCGAAGDAPLLVPAGNDALSTVVPAARRCGAVDDLFGRRRSGAVRRDLPAPRSTYWWVQKLVRGVRAGAWGMQECTDYCSIRAWCWRCFSNCAFIMPSFRTSSGVTRHPSSSRAAPARSKAGATPQRICSTWSRTWAVDTMHTT